MKILHVASFHGNVGDNANHAGFRPWFQSLADTPIEWSEFEIRDIFRKTRAFDAAFAEQANAADLVVIGGGNYFELWVQNSPTGTSISIPDDILTSIRTPIFINALGVDDAQGYTDETLARFRKFLGTLLGSEQYLVSVRNDGAMTTLQAHIGDMPLHRVLHLPDGGFFASYKPAHRTDSPRIGINLAGDMLDQRFPGGGQLSYQGFLGEMAETLANLWATHPGLRLTFFPHIFRDLAVCADLLAILPDSLRRDHVRVAAYDSGPQAADEIFGEYLACDLILAMRFHSNVVPIGHGVPAIGLYCYEQVRRLYLELNAPDNLVKVNEPRFGAGLQEKASGIISAPQTAREKSQAMKNLVGDQRNLAAARIRSWLSQHVI